MIGSMVDVQKAVQDALKWTKSQIFIHETKSWVISFVSDVAADLAAGVLLGLATIMETGDYSTAALIAVITASCRTVIKLASKGAAYQMKKTAASLKKKK